jgi:hypothetical protein
MGHKVILTGPRKITKCVKITAPGNAKSAVLLISFLLSWVCMQVVCFETTNNIFGAPRDFGVFKYSSFGLRSEEVEKP